MITDSILPRKAQDEGAFVAAELPRHGHDASLESSDKYKMITSWATAHGVWHQAQAIRHSGKIRQITKCKCGIRHPGYPGHILAVDVTALQSPLSWLTVDPSGPFRSPEK